MINTDKPFKGIQPFRLGGGNHQGTIQGEWSTLRNPSRGFNPLGWGGEHHDTKQEKWSTLRKPSRRFNPLGWGGKHQGTIQAEWSTLRKPSRGFNPLGWVGGGTIRVPYTRNNQHSKPLKGIQPFRLEREGKHQGTIQGEWSTLINPSRDSTL